MTTLKIKIARGEKMKSKKLNRLAWMLGALLAVGLACQGTGSASNSGAPTSQSSAVTSSSPTQAATLISAMPPANLPATPLDQAVDPDSSSMATAKNVSSGDVFVQGLYERPFNANTMDTYFPYMDIARIQGFMDDTWGYLEITLAGADKNGQLPAQYAAELDLNKLGRGEYLIRASNPASSTWTTQGVQAWKDTDGDVGGVVPLLADTKPSGGDGYETLVFDQGKGNLADGAWVRISPNDPKTVQIAFKLSMIGSPSSFAMGAWAGANIDPSMFDYNDHMTHAQAGDPNQGYPQVYPIKALAEIDNTCRLAIGFNPKGNEPGLCKTIVPNRPNGPPGAPKCQNSCGAEGQMPYPDCRCIPG
jgi:hypothetical protein